MTGGSLIFFFHAAKSLQKKKFLKVFFISVWWFDDGQCAWYFTINVERKLLW
jgi:hypothetical protein